MTTYSTDICTLLYYQDEQLYNALTSEVPILIVMYVHNCDVICEKGPYGGTKSTGFDQTPRVLRGV